MMRMIPPFSRKWTWAFFAAGVTLCLFIYIIVSLLLDRYFIKEQERFFENSQMIEVTLASRAISDRLSEVSKHFSSIAERLSADGQDAYDVLLKMESLYTSEVNNYPYLLDFSYVSYGKGELWSSSDNQSVFDNSFLWGKEYLAEHVENWKDYWVPPFSISPGLKMVALVYPLRSRQLVFGAFVVVLDLDLLIGHYAYDLQGEAPRGDVFIIDASGNIISRPGLDVSGENLFDRLGNGKVQFREFKDIDPGSFSDAGSYIDRKDDASSMLFWHSVRLGNQKLVVVSSVGVVLRRSLLSALFRRRALFVLLFMFILILVTIIFVIFHRITWNKVVTSERRYVSVVESQDELVCCFTPDFIITFANRSCCLFFGENAVDLVDKNVLDYLSFSDKIILNKLVNSVPSLALSEKKSLVQCKDAGDGNRWVNWSFIPIMNDSGSISEFQAVGKDLTNMVTLENKFLRQRNVIDDILENTPVLICMITPDGSFEMINSLGKFLLKVEKGEPVSRGARLLQSLAAEIYSQGFGVYGQSITVVDVIGRSRDLSLNLVPRKDDNGEISGVLIAGIDVSDQRTLGRELLEDRELKYLQILENIGDAVLICTQGADGIHRVNLSNVAARRIRGKIDENFDGVSLSHIFNVDSLKKLEKALSGYEYGEAFSLTGSLLGFTGVVIPVEMTMMSFKQDDVSSLLIVMRDVSERLRLREREKKYTDQLRSLVSKLNSVERDQKYLMANYLHDVIGQNLASIKIRLGIGLRKCHETSKEPFEQALSVVNEVISETRAIIFDLANPLLDQIGFDAAMDQLIERFKLKNNLTVTFIHDGIVDDITESARDFIYQAVREFLVNVVKHGKTDSATVSVKSDGAFVWVWVKDKGVGFDTSQLVDIVSKRMSFGLFSLKERIREMGGDFRCSSAIENGTAVGVKLPLKSILKEANDDYKDTSGR